ncbi:MAG: DEAD/DEAH box helicase [Planctomycetes bacterium]|nr:DEAD/DEAH box helicase [Planctomycetota bacterium]
MRFDEIHLKPEIQKALAEMGFTELTPVQEQTLPFIMEERDLIALAQTGSGKTAACAIPLIQRVDSANPAVQALIIVPTRELALQYVAEIAAIAKYTNVRPFAVYGGFSMDIQTSKLTDGVQILVATPGRLIDLLYNTPLRLSEVVTFVLDEADEMLNLGFLADVEFIFSCLIHQHQTMLFSATIPKEIKNLAKSYLKDPITVELNIEQVAPESLEHYFMQIKPVHRFEKLMDYLNIESPEQAILFCNSRTGAEKLYHKLKEKIDSVEIIHGGLEQSRRTSLFRRFRDMKIRYMVATDIAGRGLDFSHVTHVINYDFPRELDAYTHRTGRTARMGRRGKALTLIAPSELGKLRLLIHKKHIEPQWLGPAPDLQKPHAHHDEKSYSHRRGGRSRPGGRGRDSRHHRRDKGPSS